MPGIQGRSRVLILIVVAQFACVSLWFAGNGVMEDLIRQFHLDEDALGHLTSAVQFGFILGTLLYALFAIADRISPSAVFFVSSLLAALSNLSLLLVDGSLTGLFISRFFTGFFLAGIYPVGMKIAADYFDKDLSKALGFLIGALVLGTAFPHLLRSELEGYDWRSVIIITSVLAVAGGITIRMFVPDGPFRKKQSGLKAGILADLFFKKEFRAAAFGYFGHMWELYAFWAFVPVVLKYFVPTLTLKDISLFSFMIIAVGSIGCVLGGFVAKWMGSFKVAFMALALSGICCLVSPLMFTLHPVIILVYFMFWGMTVIADSPQFSAMVATYAPAENKGSALTFVNCFGFSITIVSIQLITIASLWLSPYWLLFLLTPGPVLGLLAMIHWHGRHSVVEKSIP